MAYVYRHIRLDKNVPFYIGIGKTKYRHTTKQNRNPIWDKIVAKTDFDVEVLFDNIDWERACKKEIEFIKLYGRINKGTGSLANMTDGGDGNLGLKHTAEAIFKIGEASKGRKGNWKGKKMSEEAKLKMSISKKGKSIKGHPMSECTKEKLRQRNIGNKNNLGKKHTERSKQKMSESMQGRISWNKGKTWPKHIPHTCIGRKYSDETITKMQVSQKSKPVIKYSLGGVLLNEYISISEAARLNNVFATGIFGCCKHVKGVKTYKGYIWEYKIKNNEN